MSTSQKVPPLDRRPARELSDRECCKILGGLIGGLLTMTTVDTAKAAIRWWADNDAAWEPFRQMQSGICQDAFRHTPEGKR